MAARIVLYTQTDAAGLKSVLMENDANLTSSYLSAVVDKGQWIAYRYPDYNPSSWGSDNVQLLTQGDSGAIDFKFPPASIRKVESFGSEGVTVYQHNDYCGKEQPLSDSAAHINVGGASSIIISGGRWKLFTQPEYAGPFRTLGPDNYPTPDAMGFPNDSLRSIEKAQ